MDDPVPEGNEELRVLRETVMQLLLKKISSLVFLFRPLGVLFRLFSRFLTEIVQSVRPTTKLTRVCYVLLGIALLFGASEAEQFGHRNCACAIAMSVVGAILLFLFRGDKGCQVNDSGPLWAERVAGCLPPSAWLLRPLPSDLLKFGWVRNGVAVNRLGEPVPSDSPAADAWSLAGAVNAVFEPDSDEWKSYMTALQKLVGHNLVRWNGDSDRAHEEVVAAALLAESSCKPVEIPHKSPYDKFPRRPPPPPCPPPEPESPGHPGCLPGLIDPRKADSHCNAIECGNYRGCYTSWLGNNG